jgi:hypothetical protein
MTNRPIRQIAVALLLALAASAPSQDGMTLDVPNGRWAGSTGQGRSYEVTTQGNTISQLKIGYSLSGCSGTTTISISPAPSVSGSNTFFASAAFCAAGQIVTAGTFDPGARTASGTLSMSATPIPFVCGCSGSLSTTWTAVLNPPTLNIGNATVAESHSGTTLLGFKLTLSEASTSNVTVSYGTSAVTATVGVDYTAASGTFTIPAGSTSKQLTILIHGDTVAEPDETFSVVLSNPAGVSLGTTTGTGTILNDDPAGTATTVTQYRLYHDGTKEHLYTTDLNEYNVLGGAGWAQEGVAYKMLTNGVHNGAATAPLFRLYHPGILQHHWTTDSNEARVLSYLSTWFYEGIVGYLSPSQVSGTVPLYRMALENPPIHLWTTDQNEYDTLATRGWVKEGVIGYVVP